MKLLAKFNLILTLVFGAGLATAAFLSHQFLQDDAREEVVRQARLMMEAMRSARDYTSKQVKPLLVTQQEHQKSFLPQTVPAFAAVALTKSPSQGDPSGTNGAQKGSASVRFKPILAAQASKFLQ